MDNEALKQIQQLKHKAVVAQAYDVAIYLRDAEKSLIDWIEHRKARLTEELSKLEAIDPEPIWKDTLGNQTN